TQSAHDPDLIQSYTGNQQSDDAQRRGRVKKVLSETGKSLRPLGDLFVRFHLLLFLFFLLLLLGFRLRGGEDIYDNGRLCGGRLCGRWLRDGWRRGGRIAGSGLLI